MGSDPGDACVPGGLGDGFGHGRADPGVEGLGDDIVGGELLMGDEIRQGVGGGHIHLIVDFGGPDIKGPPEDAGEGQKMI